MADSYDAIVVGTGFASSFFLHEVLRRRERARVLVLEKGERWPHARQLRDPAGIARWSEGRFENATPGKPWFVSLAFGGGSNCWWAVTPRLLPADLRLATLYGVGRDWPLAYEDLEPWYARAEDLMAVAGPDPAPSPRSGPYPLPPHRPMAPDRALAAAYPGAFLVQPCARPSADLPSGRPRCCASGVCSLCPIDSKFTVANELAGLYADERVALRTGASVQAVEVEAGVARGVRWLEDGRERSARGELVALGANALFNPHILQRSGLAHRQLGRNLFEQASLLVDVFLDGMDSLQGSTSLTGHGYMLYDGPHRRERPAALIETSNVPLLRVERGRWRQRLRLKCILEDLPLFENRVEVSAADPERPAVTFERRSRYLTQGEAAVRAELERVLAVLPVERLELPEGFEPTESHVLGTARMGADPADSVVDADLVHHGVRNLLVLGGSAFPTGAPANPTLTIAALSLRAAARLLG